jgi:hypothetical protein
MESVTMKVWVRGHEVDRPVVRIEERIKVRFGGFQEVYRVPIPQLNPGERIEKRKHRTCIIPG